MKRGGRRRSRRRNRWRNRIKIKVFGLQIYVEKIESSLRDSAKTFNFRQAE